jgi:hypothetical protein
MLSQARRVVVVSHGRSGELDAAHPPGQCREQRFGLEPGDVLADALVEPHPEPDVAGGVAGEVERVGVGPTPRVAVGRAEEHEDLLALRDDVLPHSDVDGGRAEEGLHR